MNRKRSAGALAALFSAVLLLALLSACGGSAAKNVPVSDVSAAVVSALGNADTLAASDGMFLGLTGLGAEELGEYAILLNVYGTNVDEFGVFKGGTGSMDAAALKAAAEDYLQKRLAAWMDEYMPEEKPKLTDAEVRTRGDYVMYCILSDADKRAAFDAFEQALR